MLLRSSPWGCFAPSPSSTWGASTASCAAAWFRGSSRKRRTRGNSIALQPSPPPSLTCTSAQPWCVWDEGARWGFGWWGGVQEVLRMHFRCQLLPWQMFTLCYSSDITPPWTWDCFQYFLSATPVILFPLPVWCQRAFLGTWEQPYSEKNEGRLNIPLPASEAQVGFEKPLTLEIIRLPCFSPAGEGGGQRACLTGCAQHGESLLPTRGNSGKPQC